MKQLAIVVFLIFYLANCFSQERVGYKISEIKEEYKDPVYKVNTGYTKNEHSVLYLELFLKDRQVIHYFDSAQVCVASAIIPDNEVVLSGIIETYNKNYVIISDTKWKRYTSTGIINISLEYTKNQVSYLYWDR